MEDTDGGQLAALAGLKRRPFGAPRMPTTARSTEENYNRDEGTSLTNYRHGRGAAPDERSTGATMMRNAIEVILVLVAVSFIAFIMAGG